MKQVLIPASGAKTDKALTLFFTGWGMDQTPLLPHLPRTGDCLVCYDYTDGDFDPAVPERYPSVRLVAWSMGVWACGQAAARLTTRIESAVAVNGTPQPIHDAFGIPAATFADTLRTLTPRSLAKFQRRMCAGADDFAAFRSASPARQFDDVRRELGTLANAAVVPSPFTAWTHAVIGERDRIFPCENQRRAWRDVPHTLVDCGHYGDALWRIVFNQA